MLRKSLILVSCLFVLALAIIGCGGGGGGSASNPTGPAVTIGETANLSGTVLFNNAPTPFASVHLYKSDKAHTVGMAQLPALKGSLVAQQIIGDGAYSTTTSAEGVYNFTSIPVGQYTLIAMRDETTQFVQTGVLLGQVTTLNPQLTPTGKITGNVTLSIGGTAQAIAGAFVYINGTSYIAVSDTAGNFTINNVPSNTLTTSSAYEILVSSTRGSASPVTGVVVNPGATTDIGTIAMTAPAQAGYATLNGSLVAGKGVSDLSGMFVILTHQTSGSIFGTHTDATGNFQFRVMETGDFLVLCPEADYTFTPDPLTVNVSSLANQAITLSPITVDADQNEATGSIIGTVSNLGSPFAGAIINVTGTSLLGISDSSGNFIINKVPVNTSLTPYTLELSSDKGTAATKTDVIVSLGQATAVGDFAITVPTTGFKTITGQLAAVPPVTAADLGNRLVHLTDPDGRVSAAYSDSTGAFSFMATQIGLHTATVMESVLAYAPRTQPIDITVLDNGTQALASTINVSNPNIDNKVRVNGVVSKVIKVKPETDNSGVSLKLDPEAAIEQNMFTFSRADGSFEFFVVPGTYTLTVEGLYQLDPPSPIIINVTSPYTFATQINVRPTQAVNSIVSGSVTWPAVAGWSFIEGEVILEGASFVDRRIVSNVSPTPFRFENVPAGSYVLKSNPLRNGYDGVTAAFMVSEGVDLTGLSLATNLIAPVVASVSPTGTVSGSNFGTIMANIEASVDDRTVTFSSLTDTSCVIDLSSLTPGEHVIQMHKTITAPAGKLSSNKRPFFRPVLSPLAANFIASSTDTTITFTWQNEPFVNEVEISLLQGAAVVRPLQRIIGNSFTYDNLLPNTTYSIEVSSTYPNVTTSVPTSYPFTTKADSINNISSFPFTGAGIATGTIFGFEVVGNNAYVAFDNDGALTIQSFNLTTNALLGSSIQIMTTSNPSSQSLAANSTGVYLTYASTTNDIAAYPLTLGSPAATRSLDDYGIAGSNMATVRSLNNRIFLSSRESGSGNVEVRELNTSLAAIATYSAATSQTSPSGKTVDVARDNVTNTLYLINTDMMDTPVRAFSGMDIEIAGPPMIGKLQSVPSIINFSAANNQVFITAQPSTDPVGYIMDPRSSFIRNLGYPLYPANFGHDKQHRIWMRNAASSGNHLLQLDDNLSVQKSLSIYNTAYITNNCSLARLEPSTGIMYMLHFNASNQLAVYRYNSNY